MRHQLRNTIASAIVLACLAAAPSPAQQVNGVADGIPQPTQRNVIVQLFNWKFADITQEIPNLQKLGYSHIHVSPPEKSVEITGDWWERYQPVDFTVIDGPLGTEDEFKKMTETAHNNGIKIIADVVFNHTIDISTSANNQAAVDGSGHVTKYQFPDFTPANFHDRCNADNGDPEKCWLSNNLMDLRTETDEVRQAAKNYLTKLAALGAEGFRFDAAKNIEHGFFPEVMKVVPGNFTTFGEFVSASVQEFGTRPNDMQYYDFPLLATMRAAFAFDGDLAVLTHLSGDQALDGLKAVTFVRNHDLAYNQVDSAHGINDNRFEIGWDQRQRQLNRTEVLLAYAFILAREEGTPYVFVGMKGAPSPSDDPDNDPDIVAAIRFHNLCLQDPDGKRHVDAWFLQTKNAIGLTKGDDRFAIINKADPPLSTALPAGLQAGTYMNVRTGETIQVQQGGGQQIQVNGRTAAFFVKV